MMLNFFKNRRLERNLKVEEKEKEFLMKWIDVVEYE